MNNSIYIRRKNKLYVEGGNSNLPDAYLLNMLKNVEVLGYTFSEELLEVIRTLPVERLKTFYNQLIKDLKENVGASVDFKPMYPNFPEQVVNASDAELYGNAFIHYLGDWLGRRILPNYEKKEREELKDKIKLKVIGLGAKEDFNSIFPNLLSSKSSISETDKKDLEWFIKNRGSHVLSLLPETIPLKENVALLVGTALKNNLNDENRFSTYVKTATDVLRIVVALSDGDISLAEDTKFKSISRKNRRLLLGYLERCNSITEDMLRYKEQWKRAGEKLHPFGYKNRYPRCFEAFDTIRNDRSFLTFNGKVEKAIKGQTVSEATLLLKTRPGDFARRLDKLLRTATAPDLVIADFAGVVDAISSPVLLQVKNHFQYRNEGNALRTFFPKGNVGKAVAIDNNLPVLKQELCDQIVGLCDTALLKRFATYKPLGRVFIGKKLADFTVPFGMRSASKALKTIPRGSRLDLPEGGTIRFFIYWKDGQSRTDLDLSALALDKESNLKTTIAYYNLREIGGCHSGDITSAPEGASEFIDLDIEKFKAFGARYIMMIVNSYTYQNYCDLPVCFAGFMMRQFPDSGEIFEPVTVENKFDLTANSKIAIPLIIDLDGRKIIWTDLSLTRNPAEVNNVHSNLSSVTIINKAMTALQKPNLYDLFSLHAQARGALTEDINLADTIFAIDKGTKPSDIDVILSEYL